MKLLGNSEKEVFKKYCIAQEEIDEISRYATFSYALKFGVLLMTEMFMNSHEVIGEDLEI